LNRLLPLALALLITACAAPAAPVVEAPTPAVSAPTVEAEPAVGTPEPEVPLPVTPAPITVDMNRIEGQTPTDVIGYLGTPSLVRRDDAVQVMIFETGTCVVEVIFFEPANGDHFRAHRVNTRSRTGQDVDTENCVRRQLEINQ